MHDGTTLIVDVEQIDDKYVLSLPAEDLWVAYEVVRRHIDADGVRHYSQMTAASMTDDGYEFTFDTGDVFVCASHLLRPASDTCSDASEASSPIMEAKTKNTTVYSTVLGEFLTGVEVRALLTTELINGYELPGLASVVSADKALLDGVELEAANLSVGASDGKIYLALDDATASGKSFKLIDQVTYYPASCINLYDPNDPHEDESYLADYATNENGTYTLDSTYDAAPAYERLRRGQPVWLRGVPNDAPDNTNGAMSLVTWWGLSDDSVTLTMYSGDDAVTTENFSHDS